MLLLWESNIQLCADFDSVQELGPGAWEFEPTKSESGRELATQCGWLAGESVCKRSLYYERSKETSCIRKGQDAKHLIYSKQNKSMLSKSFSHLNSQPMSTHLSQLGYLVIFSTAVVHLCIMVYDSWWFPIGLSEIPSRACPQAVFPDGQTCCRCLWSVVARFVVLFFWRGRISSPDLRPSLSFIFLLSEQVNFILEISYVWLGEIWLVCYNGAIPIYKETKCKSIFFYWSNKYEKLSRNSYLWVSVHHSLGWAPPSLQGWTFTLPTPLQCICINGIMYYLCS